MENTEKRAVQQPSESPPTEPVGECKKSGKKKQKFLLLFLLLFILFLGAGAFFWWKSRAVMDSTTKYWFDKMAEDGVLEGKSPQEMQGMLDSIVELGMFNVSVNARVIFQSGKDKGALGLENIKANRYYCRVVLKKDSGGKVIYKSEGIKPGQYIDEITLNENLPSGTYPCTAQVIVTDPESLEEIGQVDVHVEIVIVN